MARRPRGDLSDTRSLVLDSQGLSAATGRTGLAFVFVLSARQLGVPVHVSAVTLAEVLRGGQRDARVHALLKGCQLAPVSREIGRAAGELLGRAGRSDTVDAVVAVTAATLPAPVRILTSDPGDLGALTGEFPAVTVDAV